MRLRLKHFYVFSVGLRASTDSHMHTFGCFKRNILLTRREGEDYEHFNGVDFEMRRYLSVKLNISLWTPRNALSTSEVRRHEIEAIVPHITIIFRW